MAPEESSGFSPSAVFTASGSTAARFSIGLATSRYGRPGAVADNLRLPFPDAIADVVISDGVIHHTEDPRGAFAENLRILKPGGRMYLGVYKASGRYRFLYKYPGAGSSVGCGPAGTGRWSLFSFRRPTS